MTLLFAAFLAKNICAHYIHIFACDMTLSELMTSHGESKEQKSLWWNKHLLINQVSLDFKAINTFNSKRNELAQQP